MNNFNKSLDIILKGEHLTKNEAEEAINEVMCGKVSEVMLSSWLTALKVKGETFEEIAGLTASMLKYSKKITLNDKNAIDIVGTGGDQIGTINISTTSAFVVAATGIIVAKHGNNSSTSKSGGADVLSELGFNLNLTPDQTSECLNTLGISFLYAKNLHPAFKFAAPIRKQLPFRTVFNIVGPLINPARVKHIVIGVCEKRLCRLMAQAAKLNGYSRVIVAHGNDGLDEITTTDFTHICELKNNEIKEYKLYPEEFGIRKASIDDIKGKGPDYNAQVIRDIFSGKLTGPKKDIVLINSASAILAANKVNNWKSAIELADNAIKSGAAAKKLEEVIQFTQKF
ncbi:MAG TPA: anthranilate phosphoribosyltransferase [Victivallales bacterium]|nr:anthranilate phosphoribosyltransferase [Victivallales bacterium]